MTNPISTYRIQFHKEFTFDDFEKIIPYLQKLGVGTIYASPLFEATPGSVHGYDGVHPHRINPEIGTEEQLRDITKRLKEQGINWLQDIVPNHMAFHPNNEWLMDVLEKGPQSLYAPFFDVAWNSAIYHGRIMVPFLGSSLDEVIKNKELNVGYENQRFVLKYYDSAYPLQPKSYATILQAAEDKPLQAIEQLIGQIPKMEDEKTYAERWNEIRLQLDALMKNDVVKTYIEKCIEAINNNPEQLQQITEEQSYRLCHWQETDYRINYRRFFTVNGLICLNIHTKEVFQTYHEVIKKLVDDGVFHGLRIDHIDGLYDPTGYLQQLRELAGEETYIVVEKILEPGEGLPKQWPIQGNTGYDFLSMVNNVFTNRRSQQRFSEFYDTLTNNHTSIHQQLHDKKSYILYHHMGGELQNLYQLFMETNLVEKEDYAQMRTEDIKTVIAEFLIQCPVYRYYGNALPLLENEAADVQDIFNRIKNSRQDLTPAVNLLENVLLHKPHEHNEEYNHLALRFYQRCMQFTGPLMAKGVEDTLMYTYNRFIDHNEVGDSPESFGTSVREFHQQMKDRQEQWPLSLNATSTHDTKRGEGIRARLNILTELTDEWISLVEEWIQMNADLKKNGAPDANDEYFIYQTLVGAYPMPGQDDDNIKSRLEEYLEKALREAKTHSNWTTPNTDYEEATKTFATSPLDTERPFWNSFIAFQQRIADFGMVNSLSQVLLKFTCPGVPDVYQGTELWDLSLVDPDNRRAVDYERRVQYLDKIESCSIDEEGSLIKDIWKNRYDAQIKLWLTHHLMTERKHNADLFAYGEYVPLYVEGKYRKHVLAFARKHQYQWYVVAIPLNTSQLCKDQDTNKILAVDWEDTHIVLPKGAPKSWQSVLLKGEEKHEDDLAIKHLFKHVPFALVKLTPAHERSGGVLMHITSLPSQFGVGDLGPEAIAFADFLNRSNQKYWQLLPLNPTEEGQGNSPYSSLSSKAGNPLLISPELLVEDGLLKADELQQYHLPVEDKTNYSEARRVKDDLFESAWQVFKAGEFTNLKHAFNDFSATEATWLNDFALFMLLKNVHEGKPWFQWPEEYKLRQTEALETLAAEKADDLEKIKWLQFIFSRQWKRLRDYCNNKGIQLFGDMPFYISYDSVDVWSDREIFAIDDDGNMTGVAGVPPDAFSADGQLWGMPVFKWDVLKERNYDWWIQRFKRNMELFDIVRLDHFRAFNDYWEVPAHETTAKQGEWRTGPGADLFNTALKELGSLPFIAEDLGDINDAVYQLRDQFNLPGMKILQFAFGDNMTDSIHAPHNYSENFIVYTGTHDNNTVRGWFRTEVDDANRHRLEQYLGTNVSEDDIHTTLARLAYNSVAKTVILPMQDILGLDESARMNTPSSGNNNWGWRMLPGQVNNDTESILKKWTNKYKR
jgi:malto-oligosyltrehalose synthase/4-alpha-glucanotransferase